MSTWDELRERDARRLATIGQYTSGRPITGDLAAAIASECGRPDLAARLAQATVTATAEGTRTVDLNIALRPDTREVAVTRWDTATGPVWHVEDVTVDRGEASVWLVVWVTDVDPATPDGVLALATTPPTGVEL